MKGHEFDGAFDTGENIDTHVDWSKARRPNLETRRVTVAFPASVVESLDREARLDPANSYQDMDRGPPGVGT